VLLLIVRFWTGPQRTRGVEQNSAPTRQKIAKRTACAHTASRDEAIADGQTEGAPIQLFTLEANWTEWKLSETTDGVEEKPTKSAHSYRAARGERGGKPLDSATRARNRARVKVR
jgi:hypothetical protein